MEKTISIRNTEITFSIWDLGGQREFVNMLPLVCNDAVAILFMFDLTRKSTLNSIKEWYRQARGFNKVRPRSELTERGEGGWGMVTAADVDTDCHTVPCRHEIRSLCELSARRPGRDLEAGTEVCQGDEGEPDLQQHEPQHQRAEGKSVTLRFGSWPRTEQLTLVSFPQIFKIVLSKAFDLKCTIPEIENVGEPLLLYQDV